MKKPSYIQRTSSEQEGQGENWRKVVQVWHDELYDFGKLKTSKETTQQVKEAGTISVLACL